MREKRDVVSAVAFVVAIAALAVSSVSLIYGRVPGPQGPPGETLYLPSWPPPPCEPNCSWHPVRTFTQAGGVSDNVNISGSTTRAVWSTVSGPSCSASLSVTFHHYDGTDAGTDVTFPLLENTPGSRSDTFEFPSGTSSGGIYPGAYGISIGPSNSCGGGWTWSVAIQEWR